MNTDCAKSLFLDRDGVINVPTEEKYILDWSTFTFEMGALSAIKILSGCFDYIFIVTNQRGVGKGLMSIESLDLIHRNMCKEINNCGGRISRIYYCTDLNYSSRDLKPNIGMGLKAKVDFPDICFENSVMIGDSVSDIEFGKRLNMKTIGVGKLANSSNSEIQAHLYCSNLLDAAIYLRDIVCK